MLIKYLLNRFLGGYSYHHRLSKALSKPEVYAFETTNICNLRCIMCPYPEMTRKTGVMNLDLFKKIVDEIKAYSRYICLHNFGEPLINPELQRFIEYASEAGLKTWFSTNATLLNEARSLQLLDSRLDTIIFSLDGATRDTYDKIRQNGHFEKTKANIERFLEMKKRKKSRKPVSIVQIINMINTENEVASFKREWIQKADEVLVKSFAIWSNQVSGIKELSKEDQRIRPIVEKRYPCLYLWRSVVVQWNGKVVLCCNDFDNKLVVGDASQQALIEIWNSPVMQDLRTMHLHGDFDTPICQNCREWIGEPSTPLFPLTVKNLRKAKRFFSGSYKSNLLEGF
jgi:radical SAM protein with 4Fe4S-binding SPASM domain